MNVDNVCCRLGKVAVLMGGHSQEREVSLASGQCVLSSLLEHGVDAHPFDPLFERIYTLKAQGFDRVFNVLHGGIGENGSLQGALDILGVPYTGDGVLPAALSFDKVFTKMLWKQAGLSVPNYCVVVRDTENITKQIAQIISKLNFPLFVKPVHNGSSIAVSKVYSEWELSQALHIVFENKDDALVEEAITGHEYTYTLLHGVELPLIRILSSGNFYDYHAKYIANDTQYLVPCELEADEMNVVRKLCVRAFHTLNCQFWGRVDFIIDRNNNCYFLEINTSPGLTSHSLVPKAAAAIGMNYHDLIIHLLNKTFVSF